jgi:hypothetical protein
MPVQLPRPEISVVYDVDGPAAVKARLPLLKTLAAKGTLIAGAHMPFPGFGRMRKVSWEPVSYLGTRRDASADAGDDRAHSPLGESRRPCERLRFVRQQQHLPHVPGPDCDADQLLVPVEYLGKLLERTAKSKLLDVIDRH